MGISLALGSGLALAGTGVVAAAPAASSAAIPAMPLKQALNEFAQREHLQLVYVSAIADGVRTQGADDGLSAQQTLQQLLRGTGLQYRYLNANTVTISRADPPGQAQVTDPPQAAVGAAAPPPRPRTLKAIIVTGSHISAAELATANPVIAISAQEIQQTGDQTLGQAIQNLPAITGPVFTPTVNNEGGTNATGSELVGLRGLGSSRTLVLVDGERVLNQDLNAIPTAAVERIEVLTNGASSVYGSDAIGGVINIILKSHYQGAQFSANYGISDHGDGERRGYSFMFGQTSDKGSILAGVSYNKMDPIMESARKFARDTLSITGNATTPIHVFKGGSSFTPGGFIGLPKDLQAQFGCKNVSLNPGAAGSAAPVTLADYHCFNPETDLFNFGTVRPLIDQTERTNAFFKGTYHISDDIDATATVLHNKTDAGFNLGPPVWGSNSAGEVVSKDSMYNPFGVDFTPSNGNIFRSRLIPTGNRFTAVSRTSDEMLFGLHGRWSMFNQDWSWDVGYNYGHIGVNATVMGMPNLNVLNPGLGPSMLVNGVPSCVATPGDPATVIANCVPWDTFDLDDPQNAKVLAQPGATSSGLFNTYDIERIKYADVSGGLFDLPAGTAQLALGLSWRTEYTNNNVGAGLLVNARGSCILSSQCTSHLQGGFGVKEAYAELFVPLLKDVPFVHRLSLDLGDRYSKFSDFGSTNNWKIGLEYRPIEDLLLRGTVSEVFRAPTIGDIFAAPTIGGQVLNSDPCNGITSPNPACVGVPTDGSFVDTAVALHQQINVEGTGSAFANFPLGPENGKSFDFGAVWSPHFVSGLSISADTWRIYLDNVITGVGGQTILNACFTGLAQFCPLIHRFGADTASPGQILRIFEPTANLGRIDVKGTDLQATYVLPPTPVGRFTVNLAGTYMDQYNLQTAPGLAGNQVIGEVGNLNSDVASGLGNLIPRIRGQGTLAWQLGDLSASWRMQYIGRFDVGSPVLARGYSAVPGIKGYVLHYGAYVYNDLQVGYTIRPLNTHLQVGVNNVFDKQPPLIYENITGLGNGNTDSADFDVIGRYYWARATVDF
ncbi:MAG TPA: TonB-dependent receptor [Rhodanobacteraceae bacterium]|nr:TonB-dependent receptor [Rhodanobacteraceae bacterium]